MQEKKKAILFEMMKGWAFGVLYVLRHCASAEERSMTVPVVSAVGSGPTGTIILFTHLRRCGGTFLEEALLKPHVKALGVKALLCKEGELARHHRLAPEQRSPYRAALREASLVWRHCPYGVHSLLGRARPYAYVTMLRRPSERMVSWFAYCDRYSPDKCKTGKTFGGRGDKRVIVFYEARQRKYHSLDHERRKTSSTFHEDWLEFALDDNYAVRMICGADAHDASVPLPDTALDCAKKHLRHHYAFVGTLERRDESLCLLTKVLGIPNTKAPSSEKLRGPTTHTQAAPANFLTQFSAYLRLDDQLYELADSLLEARLVNSGGCLSSHQ